MTDRALHRDPVPPSQALWERIDPTLQNQIPLDKAQTLIPWLSLPPLAVPPVQQSPGLTPIMASDSSKPDDYDRIADARNWQDVLAAHFLSYQDRARSLDLSSLGEAQRTMDKDLETLVALITSFRFQRNHLSPVNRLPPEVLARIFMFTQTVPVPPFDLDTDMNKIRGSSFEDTFAGHESSSKHQHQFYFTHTCRRWRDVALQTPALWANITCDTSKPWCQEMVSRAQSAPLTVVRGLVYGSDFPDMPTHVASQLQHLVLLGCGGWESIQPAIEASQILQTAAPILESLFLSHMRLEEEYYDDSDSDSYGVIPDSAYRLPADLFGGQCPMLRRLSLRGLALPWTSKLWGSHITHMEMDFHEGRASAIEGSFEDFFHCLMRMPALELLRLTDCLPTVPPSSTQYPPLDLPNLRNLSIDDLASKCEHLLDRLHCTALSRLKVGLWSGYNAGPDWLDAVVPALTRHVHQSLGERPVRAAQISEEFATADVKVWYGSDESSSEALFIPVVHLSLRDAHYADMRSPQFLATLCSILPFYEVEDLDLTSTHTRDMTFDTRKSLFTAWLNILGRCDRVRLLSLNITSASYVRHAVFTALTRDIVTQKRLTTVVEGTRIFFPELKTLNMNAETLTGIPWSNLKETIDSLVQQLSLRQTFGMPVHALYVDTSQSDRKYKCFKDLELLALNGVVSTVELVDWNEDNAVDDESSAEVGVVAEDGVADDDDDDDDDESYGWH